MSSAAGSSASVPSFVEEAEPLRSASRYSAAHVVPGTGQSVRAVGHEVTGQHLGPVAVGHPQLHGRLGVDTVGLVE